MKTAIKTYHRPDGVVGCGFYGEFGGLWQHSIAWPDQSATRMRFEDLEERQIEVKDLAVVPFGGRDLIDMANSPCGDYRFSKGGVQKVNVNKNGDSMIVEDVYVGPPAVADQKVHPLEDSIKEEPYVTEQPAVDPPALEDANPFDPSKSEASNIRIALSMYPDETNKSIIEILNSHGVDVSSAQVTRERKAMKSEESSE